MRIFKRIDKTLQKWIGMFDAGSKLLKNIFILFLMANYYYGSYESLIKTICTIYFQLLGIWFLFWFAKVMINIPGKVTKYTNEAVLTQGVDLKQAMKKAKEIAEE